MYTIRGNTTALDWLDEHVRRPWGSQQITDAIGSVLNWMEKRNGILAAAWKRGVPIYIPAFTDSEMGLDLSFWSMWKNKRSSIGGYFENIPPFNPYLDLNSYARRITAAKRLGIFTIGGMIGCTYSEGIS